MISAARRYTCRINPFLRRIYVLYHHVDIPHSVHLCIALLFMQMIILFSTMETAAGSLTGQNWTLIFSY